MTIRMNASDQAGTLGYDGKPTANGMRENKALPVWYHMVMESEDSSLMILIVVKAAVGMVLGILLGCVSRALNMMWWQYVQYIRTKRIYSAQVWPKRNFQRTM